MCVDLADLAMIGNRSVVIDLIRGVLDEKNGSWTRGCFGKCSFGSGGTGFDL